MTVAVTVNFKLVSYNIYGSRIGVGLNDKINILRICSG